MEEDTEVLDWGNEDDEVQVSESYRTSGQDDAEDAVSLGGDEDDEIYPYKTASHEDLSKSQQSLPRSSQTPQQASHGKRDPQRENSSTPQKPSSRATDSSQLRRSQSLGHLTHALPPKPTFAPPPSPLATPATTSTLASAMVFRERRSNGHSKNVSGSRDRGTELPPDWEERYPRTGGSNPYYYNVKTHESTWARPGFVDSGSPSPAKGRDGDVARISMDLSPRRNVADDAARSPRKESKRRTSPDGSLTYDERHYRPVVVAAPNGSVPAVDTPVAQVVTPRLPPRPLSPRVPDRRRDARPVSPSSPRRQTRSVERPGRSHRALSPPPSDRVTSRRDVEDVRQSPVQDRAWERSRLPRPQENPRGRDFPPESSAPRGRRLRDDTLPEHPRHDQELRASRPRSPPPHLRDALPQRRYVDHEAVDRDSRQKSRFDGPSSPLLERARVNDSYVPADTIPQRRTRDYDPERESDLKRRRVDDEPYRRRTSLERASYSPRLDRQSLQAEVPSAKKRAPLPPQSEHFREVARGRPVVDVPSTHPPPYTAPRQAGNYADARGSVPHPAAPSAPRGHPVPPSREVENRNHISRSRYDNVRTDDLMDVDYPSQTSRSGSSRDELPPSRSRGNDRPVLDLHRDTLPKGPRAMSRAHGSVSHTPPSPSPVLPSVPIRMPEPASSSGRLDRAPPPHMRQDNIPPPRVPGPPSGPKGGYDGFPQNESRRPSRFQDAPSTRDAPPSSVRRDGELSQAALKLSGTNNIPIGFKRPLSAAPPLESPTRSTAIDRAPVQHPFDVSQLPSYRPPYPNWQGADHRRADVAVHESQSVAVTPSPQFDMPQLTTLPRPRDDAPSASNARPGRQSRFGPLESGEPPRIWLTREESMSRNAPQDSAPSTSRSTRGSDNGRDDPPARYDAADRRRRDRNEGPPRHAYYSAPPSPPSLDRRAPVVQRSTPPEHPPERREVFDSRAREYGRDPSHYEHGRREPPYSSRIDVDDRRAPVHPESAHGFEPSLPPVPIDAPPPVFKLGIGRGRRDRAPEFREPPPYERSNYQDDADFVGGSRPPVRRGASLLDRLSLDDPPVPPPQSLTERLQDPPKRSLPDAIGLPPRPSAETTFDAEMNAAFDGGRGRGKKRNKRGRRI